MRRTIVRILSVFAIAGILCDNALSDDSGQSERPEDQKRSIVFLGDSLTAGYGLDESASYPSLIDGFIARENLPWKVVNAGVSGDTSSGGLRRISWLLRNRVDILVLALGANDGLRGISPELTKQNLIETVKRTRAKYPSVKVLIAGMLVPPNMGSDYSERFAEIFPLVAKEAGAEFLPFLLEGVAAEPKLNLPDGIHPNEKGYELVAKNVWQKLRPLLNHSDLEKNPSAVSEQQ